ncbi:hypothetical protein AB5J62_09150 [Amycolatopsis sp. cg5]|uniref:hypothetical protein n=1 Tax=Amycolatopsis sp. cg5 TaxID=3238802 RepID=UPI0035266B91
MAGYRFFFDAGSGTVLWHEPCPADGASFVDLDELPVSTEMRAELWGLVEEYDTWLNWDDPGGPGLWDEARCVKFNEAVRQTIARLRAELGPDRPIYDQHWELHEETDTRGS